MIDTLAPFKQRLITNNGTGCGNCSLRYAQPVPYKRYPIYQNKQVVVLGGEQLSIAKITRLINVCFTVYGKDNVSYWPSHICLKVGAHRKGKLSPVEACSPITDRLLLRRNVQDSVIIASNTSQYADVADIVVSDKLFTEKDYATLRFRLTYHKANNYRFPLKPTKNQFELLNSTFDDGAALFRHWIDTKSVVSLDTETNSLYAYAKGASFTLFQFTGPSLGLGGVGEWEGTYTVVCDLTKKGIDNYPTMRELLETNSFLLHNATFDANFIHKIMGIEISVADDTMLIGHLCKEVRPHGLTTYYAREVLGWGAYDDALRGEMKRLKRQMKSDGTLVVKEHKNNPIVERPNYSDIDRDALYEYSALDTQAVWALKPVLDIIVKQDRLERMNEVYRTMRAGLGLIQRQGVFIDRPRLKWLDNKVETMLRKLTDQYPINLASTQQVARFIFDDLGLTERKSHKWKKGSVKEVALAHLTDNEHVRKILKARTLMKMRGTYTHGFLASLYSNDTIMPSYNITSAKTGRISASNPPLQTIPRPFGRIVDGLDLGAIIRSCVCMPFANENPHHERWYDGANDWKTPHRGTIVAGDLSQAELRILAALSGSKFFLEVYRQGRDLHSEVAARIFGPQFTKHHRSIAKGLNFGFAYGGNLEVLAVEAGATPAIAKQAAKHFKELTGDYTLWKNGVVDEIMSKGMVTSPMGRVRRWYNPSKRYEILKQGPNSLIQGISSDITNLAAARLALSGYRVFLLWHDGIYIYADEGREKETAKALQDALLGTFREYVKEVPVKMDTDISPRIYMFGKQ